MLHTSSSRSSPTEPGQRYGNVVLCHVRVGTRLPVDGAGGGGEGVVLITHSRVLPMQMRVPDAVNLLFCVCGGEGVVLPLQPRVVLISMHVPDALNLVLWV